jgi:hypothetical protein
MNNVNKELQTVVPLFWFYCVYGHDVPEDPEDLFNIVYFLDVII